MLALYKICIGLWDGMGAGLSTYNMNANILTLSSCLTCVAELACPAYYYYYSMLRILCIVQVPLISQYSLHARMFRETLSRIGYIIIYIIYI